MDKDIVMEVIKDKHDEEYPSKMTLCSETVPEVANWTPGKKYRLTEVIIEEKKAVEDDGKITAHFVIHSAKANGEYKK